MFCGNKLQCFQVDLAVLHSDVASLSVQLGSMNADAIIAARNLDHVPVHRGLLRGPAESEKRSTFFFALTVPSIVHNGEHCLPGELGRLHV